MPVAPVMPDCKPDSLLKQLEDEQPEQPDWVVDAKAVRKMAQEFFEEWMTDRGDGVPEDSIRKIAQRACRAAAIFEEEWRDFKDEFWAKE